MPYVKKGAQTEIGRKIEMLAEKLPYKEWYLPDPYNPTSYMMPIGMISKKFTDLPWYDNLLKNPEYFKKAKGIVGEVIEMSPFDYLNEIARKIFKKSYQETTGVASKDLVSKYARELPTADFPMPVIDYATMTQEGRHRALAALKAGIEKIPVLVVRKAE